MSRKTSKPLLGMRIAITREPKATREVCRRLKQLGAETIALPVLDFAPPSDTLALDSRLRSISSYNWVVFTSANGVRFFFTRLQETELSKGNVQDIKIAAIGPRTADELRRHGIKADFIPEKYTTDQLGAFLPEVAGKRILLPRSDLVRKDLAERLRERGAIVDELVAYKTVMARGPSGDAVRSILDDHVDLVLFMSSSSVERFVGLVGDERKSELNHIASGCMGPVTAAMARSHGIKVRLVASEGGRESFAYGHLGLVHTAEHGQQTEKLEHAVAEVSDYLDTASARDIAEGADDLPIPGPQKETQGRTKASVGVLRDKAFSFYCPENLEYLEAHATRVHYINSFTDSELPDLDLLYIGGGFPEVYASELQQNRELARNIRAELSTGMQIYAECGGLMYLAKAIIDTRGKAHRMVGLIDAVVHMENKPVGHGYVTLETLTPNPLTCQKTEVIGHEFHYSRLQLQGAHTFAFRVLRGHGIDGVHEGLLREGILATYTHLHVLHNPSLIS